MMPHGHLQRALKWHWTLSKNGVREIAFFPSTCRKTIPNRPLEKLQIRCNRKLKKLRCRKCPFGTLEPVQENALSRTPPISLKVIKIIFKNQAHWRQNRRCLFNIPRPCAGKQYLTDTSKKCTKSTNLIQKWTSSGSVRENFASLCRKMILTDTSKTLQKIYIWKCPWKRGSRIYADMILKPQADS